MKSLSSVGIIAATAVSALALASCSAGHISQTANQVAAVDGASQNNESNTIAVRDVTVLVDEKSGDAALKFVVVNQDSSQKEHRLDTVTVDGKPVTISNTPTLGQNCSLVGDSAEGTKLHTQSDAGCVEYTETSLANDNFAPGGNKEVTFTFDGGDEVKVTATIAAPTPKSGTYERDEHTPSEHH